MNKKVLFILVPTLALLVLGIINIYKKATWTEPTDGVIWVERSEGLVAIQVEDDSPAYLAGIKKGDIIYKVNDSLIQAPEDLHKAVATEKSKSVHQLWIKRDAEEFLVEIFLEKRPGENHDRK